MPEVLLDGKVELHCGDSLKFLKDIPNNWFDSIVCDPPYALVSIVKRLGADNAAPIKVPAGGSGAYARASAGFMGKKWDTGETAFAVEFWAECLRVLKPGGHVVAFGGTRTYHRLACAIEDAGFEIRDMVSWTYGSGFPKSHNVSKNIDKRKFGSGEVATFKAALAEAVVRSGKTRKKINEECGFTMRFDVAFEKDPECWGCSLPTAEQYDAICRVLACGGDVDGLIALREWPRTRMEKLYKVVGYEARQNSPNGIVSVGRETVPILRELTAPGTVEAAEWEGWGTALKPAVEPICLARKPLIGTVAENVLQHGVGALNIDGCRVGEGVLRSTGNGIRDRDDGYRMQGGVIGGSELGRWPANLVHDGSDEVLAAFPQSASGSGGRNPLATAQGFSGVGCGPKEIGGFTPYADAGTGSAARFFYTAKASGEDRNAGGQRVTGNDRNTHPTVKPTDLMRYLCRLVTRSEERV